MWQERTSHLNKFDQIGREREKERERKERIREDERERLLLLSSLSGDPTVGGRWSKKQNGSPQLELRVGTEIGEFRQTPRCRRFSYLVLFLA